MIAASEALMLAKRLKMDIKKVHKIIKEASGNNWALTNYTPLPDLTDGVPSNNKYRPGFTAAMMKKDLKLAIDAATSCLLYTSPSPRDAIPSRMPSSA